MLLRRAWTRAPLPAAYAAAGSPAPFSRALHSARILYSAAPNMAKVNTSARLAELRRLMKERQVDVYSEHYPPILAAPSKHGLTREQWFRPRTAISLSTSHPATDDEVSHVTAAHRRPPSRSNY